MKLNKKFSFNFEINFQNEFLIKNRFEKIDYETHFLNHLTGLN